MPMDQELQRYLEEGGAYQRGAVVCINEGDCCEILADSCLAFGSGNAADMISSARAAHERGVVSITCST